MNILLIHNYYQIRGGEDAVFEDEKRALKEAGHSVVEYTRHNSELKGTVFKKLFFFSQILFGFKVRRDLKKLLKKHPVDVAHVHNVFPLITPGVYGFLKKHTIKVVQTIHNYRFICPNGLMYNAKTGRICEDCLEGSPYLCYKRRCYKESALFSWLYSYLIKKYRKSFKINIDRLIALTDFTRRMFIKAGYDPEKIVVKPNGMNDAGTKRRESRGYFLYLGRVSAEKGMEFLLDSFAAQPDYKLVVAGTGPLLEDVKSRYSTAANIEFTGFAAGEKKTGLFLHAQALIVPSIWYENYPISIVESFMYGIPVIGSQVGGIPFIIEHEGNGLLFEMNDRPGLIKQLEKASRPDVREQLGEKARSYFLANMVFSRTITRLEKIYQDVLG